MDRSGLEAADALNETPVQIRAATVGRLDRLLSAASDRIAIHDQLELGPHVHWRANSSEPMHRWLRYREAYSPALIDKLSLGQRILDPFCGCGSMLVGGALRGRIGMGIDLNPVANFSTMVKLTPLPKRKLAAIRAFANSLEQEADTARRWPTPALSISTKVFEPQILDVLLRIRSALETRFAQDPTSRNFVLLAWLASLEEVGSYFKEGNGIKYRSKKRKAGKYSDRADGAWQLARFGADQRGFVIGNIRRRIGLMLEDAKLWDSGSWDEQRLVDGSAMNLARLCGRRRFDSIIFSPPYANRFDYFESFKVELWFGGLVDSYAELSKLRKASLRSHLGADYAKPPAVWEPVDQFIEEMDRNASSWRMGVPDLLRGYFDDMRQVLAACRQVLARGGRCHVVVGNSAFAGVIIPTDVLTAKLGREVGFRSANILRTRHLTVSPQQRSALQGLSSYMRESVVVFE